MDMGTMEAKALKWRYDKIETVFVIYLRRVT